ncbi:hypothetical protein K437DRAFT_273343 [Tilletiaria anomala UBC 951]|uniref:Ribonuclease H2 subunit B wHTH domain-containing protein n=1 Tax=Tilletiaria anomala (strain ATCC 24038 / CBS 436.72 / UBC 951) TaxID=1037660 RepID=A0A066W4K4_TILAU|nr:uncharacterized protein K437DRAFT_273343 [Tilletiaria anomala UBC 951]KDN48862.1 hypothetical protein K437DRAFT_273343 [Tilletiaria anomala UBC 951]
MTDPGPSRRRIIVAGPLEALGQWTEDADREARRALLTLPHPRSGLPAYFLPYCRRNARRQQAEGERTASVNDANIDGDADRDGGKTLSSGPAEEPSAAKDKDGVLELVAIKPDTQQRSWLLGPDMKNPPEPVQIGAPPDEERVVDSVIGDGALHMLSPIDPLFLILCLLAPAFPLDADGTLSFLTQEDILERAARHWSARLASRGLMNDHHSGSKNGCMASSGQDDWRDVLEFGETAAAQEAFVRACDAQDVSADLRVYRLSRAKVLAELTQKVDALAGANDAFIAAPNTLGRKYWPTAAEEEEGKGTGRRESQKKGSKESGAVHARRRAVLQHVLTTWLSDEWVQAVAQALGVALDPEGRK